MISQALLLLAASTAAFSVVLSRVLPRINPYWRIFGAAPNFRPALVVLVAAVVARIFGV